MNAFDTSSLLAPLGAAGQMVEAWKQERKRTAELLAEALDKMNEGMQREISAAASLLLSLGADPFPSERVPTPWADAEYARFVTKRLRHLRRAVARVPKQVARFLWSLPLTIFDGLSDEEIERELQELIREFRERMESLCHALGRFAWDVFTAFELRKDFGPPVEDRAPPGLLAHVLETIAPHAPPAGDRFALSQEGSAM